MKMIAVCEFRSSSVNTPRTYNYLCEVPDNANLEDYKFAVTCKLNGEEKQLSYRGTKQTLDCLDVVFIREFLPIESFADTSDLRRLVLVFSMKEFVEFAVRKAKISNLRQELEHRMATMSIFEKVKAFGVSDPTILSMAHELETLMKE